MITLKDLKAAGAFVPEKPIKKEISFSIDGKDMTATIHVRQIGVSEYERLYLAQNVEDRMARTISEAITLGDDGKERIPPKDAERLHPAIAGAMVQAFNEVNISKKSSAPVTASSAS